MVLHISHYRIPLPTIRKVVFDLLIAGLLCVAPLSAIAAKQYEIQEGMSNPGWDVFQKWDHDFDVLPIMNCLRDRIPVDYVFGPIESSCGDESSRPCLWFVALNYYDDPILSNRKPAILQMWEPEPDESSAELIQEYSLPGAIVHEMGWIRMGNERILYVVSQDRNLAGTLACFEIHENSKYVPIISQDWYSQLIWFIPKLEPWGPTFVCFHSEPYGETGGDWQLDTLEFMTFTEGGFFRTHSMALGDVILEGDENVILSAEDLKTVVTYRLMMAQEWRESIRSGSVCPVWRTNEDGSRYGSGALVEWREVIIR